MANKPTTKKRSYNKKNAHRSYDEIEPRNSLSASERESWEQLDLSSINFKLKFKNSKELNEAQKQLLEIAMMKPTKLMFISGPAGTSKTWISILAALHLLNAKAVDELIYIRSIVESSDNKMGYLPGDVKDKIENYMVPLFEKLDEHLGRDDISILQKEGHISAKPIGFLRGLSWENKVVVADEAQSMSTKELTTLLTRIGEQSKIIICGDPMQSDIRNSGFKKMFDLFNTEESEQMGIHCFEFHEEDIVRSEILKYIVRTLKTLNS